MQCHGRQVELFKFLFQAACRDVVAGFFCCWLEGDVKDELGPGSVL